GGPYGAAAEQAKPHLWVPREHPQQPAAGDRRRGAGRRSGARCRPCPELRPGDGATHAVRRAVIRARPGPASGPQTQPQSGPRDVSAGRFPVPLTRFPKGARVMVRKFATARLTAAVVLASATAGYAQTGPSAQPAPVQPAPTVQPAPVMTSGISEAD